MVEKPEKNFNVADTAFAFAALVIGFLYWNLINSYMLGAGVTVFSIVIFTVTLIYLTKSGFRQNKGSLICLTLAILSAAQSALFDNQFISGLNFIFLTATFIYWICLSTNSRIDNKLSVYIIGDALKQGIAMPFMNFGCCASGIGKSFSKQKKGKGALAAFIGVLIFFPLLVAVIKLLTSADLAFENFMAGFFDIFSLGKAITYIGQFILGIPVAFFLFGLVYGDIKGRYSDRITAKSVDGTAELVKIAPGATIYSALTSFNIIYLLFFAVQAVYLFSAFRGDLPGMFTYAEYARRGFFELCAVSGINLGVLTLCHLTVKREKGSEPKPLRTLTIILSLLTILLIITALSKMAMYIDVYGLTRLRVYTSWFMVLLLFIFLVISIRQFKKFNSARIIVAGFIILFMVLTYGNVDGKIAKYNIDMYEKGTLKTLDIEALSELSDAAAPYIYELYLKTDKKEYYYQWSQLRSILTDRRIYGDGDFRNFNLQRYKAEMICENLL